MSLEAILEQIRKDGEHQAAELASETADEVATILAEARQEGEILKDQELKEADQTIKQLWDQELPTARLSVEREKLVMVNQQLEQVRQEALERLTHLKAKDRRALYEKLLASAGPLDGQLRCPAKEAKTLAKLTGLPLGEPLEEPGFIIEGQQQRLDLRFATLVEAAWSDHLKEVHATLMGETK